MSVKINIGGVAVDKITKAETLEKIQGFLADGRKHFLVTPYSEEIVFALRDREYRDVLNRADIALPDGIGVVWAAKFLSLKSQGFIQTVWQFVYSLFAIILAPKYIRSVIPERITGSRLIYDICKLANDHNYSLALVGGVDNVAAQSVYELKKLYPNLKINLALSPKSFDDKTIQEINDSNSDILLIAYSPPRQEKWLAQNLPNLNVKLAMGLGGTFDYIAKKRPTAPNFMHEAGLEWLWRLITQPWRIKRMWNAVPVFAYNILMYKLHDKN